MIIDKRLTSWNRWTRALCMGTLALALGATASLWADDKPAAVKSGAATAPAGTDKPLTAEEKKAQDITRVLEFMKNYQPDVHEKALRLRETEPAKFEELVLPVVNTVNYLDELKKNHPELYALKIEDYNLTFQVEQKLKELRRTDLAAAEHDKLMVRLEKLLTRQFDVGQEIRRYGVKQLKKRLEKLQADVDEREKNKDNTIKQRMKDLVPAGPQAAPTAAK